MRAVQLDCHFSTPEVNPGLVVHLDRRLGPKDLARFHRKHREVLELLGRVHIPDPLLHHWAGPEVVIAFEFQTVTESNIAGLTAWVPNSDLKPGMLTFYQDTIFNGGALYMVDENSWPTWLVGAVGYPYLMAASEENDPHEAMFELCRKKMRSCIEHTLYEARIFESELLTQMQRAVIKREQMDKLLTALMLIPQTD